MELFDKKFVYFMWDDELKGKKCFVADGIALLIRNVEKGFAESCNESDLCEVEEGSTLTFPFRKIGGTDFAFAYYDPNYEVKRAYNEGKTVQVRCANGIWSDTQIPPWSDACEYRIKPEEKEYRPYKSSSEMIADFIGRFKVKCPSYAEPLIWVKSKNTGYRYLITTFYESAVMISTDSPVCCSLWQLSDFYTYLDGSPVGMEVKE